MLSPSSAESHIFGYVLLNDWSARDIQSLEMVPLGPFNGKSFATTISPWVVLPSALAPFRVEKETAPELELAPAPEYLAEPAGAKTAFEIDCATSLHRALTSRHAALPRHPGLPAPDLCVSLHTTVASDPATPHLVSTANFRAAHWSFPQLLAYQTFSGARLQTGDLLGSGTISNDGPRRQGCLLELAKGGKEPLEVGRERRAWLEDGDEVVFSARAGPEGSGVGFGELRGKVMPAKNLTLV